MQPDNMSRNLLRCAIIYALLGAIMSAVMFVQHNVVMNIFYLNITLIGWVSMALMALTYRVFNRLTYCPWAKVQIWTHNIGLPLLLVGIYAVSQQMSWGSICTAAGAILVAIAFLAFTINAWRNAY